mgnify:CR=1 FL=1
MIIRIWAVLVCKIDGIAVTRRATVFVDKRISDTMTHRDARNSPLQGAERRVDAVTADVVEVGLLYVDVFGRSNAEAYFTATDVAPAVYRRVMRGIFRRPGRDHDPGAEFVST